MGSVTLEGISKVYGKVSAVRDLSLHVESGEFVAFVGPSGCGKSTTLQLISGLEEPSSGTVRIAGEDVSARAPGERDVAMVFQNYALYPHLDVRRNMAFPLKMARVPSQEIERRVRETAARLGIEPLLSRKPSELSGGQRQRVALGRALVRRPKVFLFDEPLSNLDPSLRAELRAQLKKLHEELNATFLYVTHDQAEAMTLSDRVVVMKQGEVQQVAPPRELYKRPQNTFVARFFGSPEINLLTPELLGVTPPRPGLLLGIRPEHVTLSDGARSVEGKVFLVEPVGPEVWLTVRVQDAQVVLRASAEADFPSDSSVRIAPDLSRLHWFDARTGVRVDIP
jgi:multiple sugar transport system ATP-binding protein